MNVTKPMQLLRLLRGTPLPAYFKSSQYVVRGVGLAEERVVKIVVHIQVVFVRDLDVAPAGAIILGHHLLTCEGKEARITVANQPGVEQLIEVRNLAI